MIIQRLLNENLYDKALVSETKLTSLLDSNVVGLFLNADWSKPGRIFLKEINKVYVEAVKRNLNFKLVYVSYDKDLNYFNDYFAENFDVNWFVWPFDSDSKK